MKHETNLKIGQIFVVLLLVATLLGGIAVAPVAQAAKFEAASINKVDGLKVDYTQYLDGSVICQLPDTIRDDQEISVIVTLDQINLMDAYQATDKVMSFSQYATAPEAQKLRADIQARTDKVLEKLDAQGIAYTAGKRYDTLLSGVELVIRADAYEAVCKTLGSECGIVMGEVYQAAETQLVENTVNVYETGIFKSGESGYDGTGMVVAVLDTGLDSNHTAFSVDNFKADHLGLTYDEVASVLSQTEAYKLANGLSVDDVYVNEKVPYGYDYADNDPDVYSTHNNHGTHVSGVIVGKDDTITGVAPNAQLVSMKVFSDVVDTARSAWILAALEDCVILGVDVINMSLGTACGFGTEGEEELTSGVYQKIREAGISLVVAASNSYSSAYGSEKNGNLALTSNPDTGTVGSPGTYAHAISVASINGEETPYIKYNKTIIYFEESTDGASEENDFFETLLGEETSKKYEYVVVPGVGRTADYTGMDVRGKIALVRRGDNTFEEKAMIAEAQGAAGIIIYNNVSGEIKMNVGDAKLAVCSIAQDDGEMLAQQGGGTLTISKEQTSGPFISDFSSWGPTPDLGIKPEITAHGGNILSSVTGGGYDRLSGTSMACPNLAGVAILLRQYVVENFPNIADDNCKVNDMINCLMMSTADIAISTNGLPYFVRKQGAGLANLMNAISTPAYLTTYDKQGNLMDKPKLELGDDPQKTGVYEMRFAINNVSDKKLSYELGSYVLTEGVSDTKTNAGEQTVTEEAVVLEGAQTVITAVNGQEHKGSKVTVPAGETVEVTVKVTLSDEDKAYLDQSFENGMYVEGYLTLNAKSGTKVNLSVPYLAFYGDWAKAPLFDLEYFETDADEQDDSIAVEDKVMADAYASRPVGGVSEDYVSYLGSYYFLQDPNDMLISATRDYICLSNQEGTIHSLRFVWAGLLRNAKKIEVVITDDTTGEVIFETVDDDVRKSYGDGGSIRPSNVEIEFDTAEYNLANNSEYTVTLTGYLDYGDGCLETNEKNVFQFPLTMDFEAPTVTNVEFSYEYDKTLKKNRLYAHMDVYDNHYAMSAQLGYVGQGTDDDGNTVPEMKTFEQYLTPIYSQKNSTTTVKLELTDYIYEIKDGARNELTFAVTCYDYALNYATYEIGLPINFVDFYFDSMPDEGITLSPNEVFTLEPLVDPATEWAELLTFTSSKPSVARVVNNKVIAVGSGSAIIKVSDPTTNKSITFPVNVLKEGDEGYRRYDKPVADIFRLTGYTTQKAYYVVDNNEKDIGDTGNIRFFEGNYSLKLYPSETVLLSYDLDAYFPKDTTVEFETSNENIVTIDDYGNVTGVAEGFASVTVKVMMDGKSTYYSESVSVEVKDPYLTTGPSLTHYYGNGGLVVMPEDLNLKEIGNFAFANFEYVQKTEAELEFDDSEEMKQWFIGDSTITKVILPEGIEKIGAYAFANLTGLEEIVLPSTLEAIEYGAFYGCSSLKKITFNGENNLKIISQNAFEGCDLQDTVDLSSVCVISNYAFAGNKKLKGVTTSESLLSIGEYAFAGCESLENMTITAKKVKYGPYAFTGCDALKEFYVNASVLPEGMFYQSKALEKVTIGPDVNEIGEFAFRETKVSTLEVQEGSKTYKVQTADHVLSADGSSLMAVAATASGAYTEKNVGGAKITAVGLGAFSHCTDVTSITLPNVTVVGEYAFASDEEAKKGVTQIQLGTLTQIGEYGFFASDISQMPAVTDQTQIGKYAFAHTELTEVTVPSGMTVQEGTFAECTKLTSVVIGDDVVLGDYAFNMDKDLSYKVLTYDENGEKYFYYEFGTALTSLTIGKNAVIGENAFSYHASLQTVTLGENAKIGKQAFYNCTALTQIDLSKAVSIGDYAFSGDEYYICLDESMAYAAVSSQGEYMTTVHATSIETADLTSAESIGEYAFAMCEKLSSVKLNPAITDIPTYAFASCPMLSSIDLSHVQTIGDYAFQETEALTEVTLTAATELGEYAFVNGKSLKKVTLNKEGTKLGEGAFAYCEALTRVQNIGFVRDFGDYAFAYSDLTDVNLVKAEKLGNMVFMKEEKAPFKVKLGQSLQSVGDNPFAMCVLEPLCQVETTEFNGKKQENKIYTYALSDTVQVIDGSLYCTTENGLELITYTGLNNEDVRVAADTVRITAYAFAGTDAKMVTMPATVFSIGHKAFYDCRKLHTVVFGSQEAPVLEEEFDPVYYEKLNHIPGTGDFGTYTDYDGNEVQIDGMGIVPYFMWNATDGLYFDVFYGASFVDYVGYVKDKLTMIRPVNGTNYESFIYGQYFDVVIDGANAPDKNTLATVAAIKALPERVTYEHKDQVEAARAMYAKIATLEQQALVVNYADLVSAEQRITALAPTEETEQTEPTEEPEEQSGFHAGAIVAIVAAVLAAAAAVVLVLRKGKKNGASAEKSETEDIPELIETEYAEESEQDEDEEAEEAEEAEDDGESEDAEDADQTDETEGDDETEEPTV
ncbi:MAG: leucine-rich repeat protein [Oscillospiraceae bacterium]|nr:leucine-rich repeat protein [Oscillospiraceae bacterium]